MLTNRTKMLKTPNSRAIVYLRPIFSNRKAVKNSPEKGVREYFQIIHKSCKCTKCMSLIEAKLTQFNGTPNEEPPLSQNDFC